jgi:hypothetical protein
MFLRLENVPMYYARYAKFRRPYNNLIPVSPLHLQYQMPKFNQINGLGSPAGWSGQVNPTGWWIPGGLAGFNSPGHLVNWKPVNQKGLNTHGQLAGWGNLGGPSGWSSHGIPMGWGNNMGQGQSGMFGGLLKVGKGALGGLGMLNNLINVGKMFF